MDAMLAPFISRFDFADAPRATHLNHLGRSGKLFCALTFRHGEFHSE